MLTVFEALQTGLFSNPIFGLIGSLASVVGVILALYFYLKGRRVRQLVYQITATRTVVVRAGQASRLKALFDDREIKTDITAAQIALWNQGKRSIRSRNILEPIVICTAEGTSILEATVRRTSRDLVGFTIGENMLNEGRVLVDWKILEHHDGGLIQLIYAGGVDVKINVEGVIEGQRSIKTFYDPWTS